MEKDQCLDDIEDISEFQTHLVITEIAEQFELASLKNGSHNSKKWGRLAIFLSDCTRFYSATETKGDKSQYHEVADV